MLHELAYAAPAKAAHETSPAGTMMFCLFFENLSVRKAPNGMPSTIVVAMTENV